jgi:hypothetical protein
VVKPTRQRAVFVRASLEFPWNVSMLLSVKEDRLSGPDWNRRV